MTTESTEMYSNNDNNNNNNLYIQSLYPITTISITRQRREQLACPLVTRTSVILKSARNKGFLWHVPFEMTILILML